MFRSSPMKMIYLFILFLGLDPARNADAQRESKKVQTIVLIHGAWADGSSWQPVVRLLLKRGFHVVSAQIPLTSFQDDVAAAKRLVDSQDGPVLLVAHSYGGVVMTEVGNDPKVVGLVYVAAFAPDTGESIADLGKGSPPAPGASAVQPTPDGFLFLTPEGIATDFAQDVSAQEKRLLAATQVPPAASVFAAKVTRAAWHDKPTWYVISQSDRMIPPVAEKAMANRMAATTISLPASHAVMISKPSEVSAFISKAASGGN